MAMRRGDTGVTCLNGGMKVSKDHAHIEACGTIDELCSFLGWAKCLLKDKKLKAAVASIQEDIFIIGAEFATPASGVGRLKRRIGGEDISRLEDIIARIEKKVPRRSYFCLPGDNPIASSLDIARSVARRAERCAVTLPGKGGGHYHHSTAYLNRLSSLLYMLARVHEKKCIPVFTAGMREAVTKRAKKLLV